MPQWWPALVFGWPGPILAMMLSVIGVVRAKVSWLVAGAVVLLPFCFYLLLTPRFRWAVLLPFLPLLAARATARGATRIAWVAVLLLVGVLVAIAGLILSGERQHRASAAVDVGTSRHAIAVAKTATQGPLTSSE